MNTNAYLLTAFAGFFAAGANAAGPTWAGFKGIYASQPSAEFKKQGFSCTLSSGQSKKSYDELCVPSVGNDKFKTYGGEKITYFETALQGGKVILINLKTEGPYGGGLEKSMIGQYGKPKKSRGNWENGHWQWDRGMSEFVSLSMGNGINEVMFAIDPTFEQDKRAAAKARQGRKDF